MNSSRIMVSACLAGICCRYDGDHCERGDIVKMVQQGEAIPFCPEQLGGLPTPRAPAEINADNLVVTKTGEDVSLQYHAGAREALKLVDLVNPEQVILKSKSPMCGINQVYDGSFTGKITSGDGILAQLLKKKGWKKKLHSIE